MTLLILSGLGLPACQRQPAGPARYPLSGTVKFGQESVPGGEILFTPESGPGTLVTIQQGKFETKPPEGGIVPGRHKVLITGLISSGSGALADTQKQFPSYETSIDVPAQSSEQHFEVPPSKKKP